nr:unnamed protein product [Naegleria fowleri]
MTLKWEVKGDLKIFRTRLLALGWLFVFLFPPVVPCLIMIWEKRKVEAEGTQTGIGCCNNYYFICGMVDVCTILLTILGWVPGCIFTAILLASI